VGQLAHRDDRIAKNHRIRPVAFARPHGSGAGGQMASGGKSHDADLVGKIPQFSGELLRHLDGLQGVVQWSGMMVGEQAVIQDKRMDPMVVQKFGDLFTLVIHRLASISAAWTDDDASTPVFRCRGPYPCGREKFHRRLAG